MKYSRNTSRSLIAFLLITAMSSQSWAEAGMCRSIFTEPIATSAVKNLATSFYETKLTLAADGKAYARGAEQGPGKEIQLGFESEYTIAELAPITNFYGPTPEAGIAKDAWLNMSLESRMNWIQEKLKSIPFGAKDPVLMRLDSTPELAFLPSKLIRDDTGNVEIILSPVSEFQRWKDQVQWINKNFGAGSMQAMVSQPRESFFSNQPGYREVALKEDLGYFNFINEIDVLERMASGAERFNADSSKKVMQPFLHPYLGPMVKFRHRKMVNTMTEIAEGKVLTKEELEAIVRREQSFKYIGSTSYRPDIGGAQRVSQEVRDAHKSEDLLIEKTARSMFYAQQGRFAFFDFGGVKAFDNKEVFEKMPVNIQDMLKSIFPVKAPKQVRDFENALQAHETYRNFSYPLKEWKPLLKALDRLDLTKTVEAAQGEYIKQLEKITSDLNQNLITADQASAQVQGALANFSLKSELYKAFKDFESKAAEKYQQRSTNTMDTRRAFEFRLQTLLNKWTDNMSLVDNVGFRYKDDVQKVSGARRVLVISTKDLSSAKIAELEADYKNLVAAHTISFPLKERATHTIVQFGGATYDLGYFPIQYFPQFRLKNYLAPQTRRIEPIVLLSRQEESHFTRYIENIRKDFKKTLGKFNLEGDPNTNGKLDDNRSPCGNNCTTFVATAPIGLSGESLTRLLGGKLSVPWIQQNPGWWGSWVLATASQERVPLAAYWTSSSLEQALRQDALSGSQLIWDFNKK